MRIVWGLHDEDFGVLVALFEAENLLQGYRDQLLRKWYDEATRPIEAEDTFPESVSVEEYRTNRIKLLDLGYDRWRSDEINSGYPRFITKKYELWNSIPPNVERLVMHFDT